MKLLIALLSASILTFPQAYAADSDIKHPNTLGEPAALVISATDAKVTQKDGKTLITLEGVHSLATMIYALHQDRQFQNFPISEFTENWNNCEKMKQAYNVGRKDGYNANFSYGKGEDNSAIASHLDSPPLITNKKEQKRIAKQDKGGVNLFVQDAVYDAKQNKLTFVDTNPLLKPGKYKEVAMVAECVVYW